MELITSAKSTSRWAALSLALVLTGALGLSLAGQKPRVEPGEPDKKPPPRKPLKEEEETGKPVKIKSPLRVDDDDEPPSPRTPRKDGSPLSGLVTEAERPNLHPEVRELLRSLAHPHDAVVVKRGQRQRVSPISFYLGPGSTYSGNVLLKAFNDQWELGQSTSVKAGDVTAIEYYEDLVLAQVKKFLAKGPDPQLTEPKKTQARLERLEAVEKILAAALEFHHPASEKYARTASAWRTAVEKRLHDRLQSVRFDQLDLLVNLPDWEEAFRVALEMAKVYDEPKVQQQIAGALGKLVELPLTQEKFEEVNKRLLLLENFPHSNATVEPIATRLRKAAEKLLQQARNAEEKKDRFTASELAAKAQRLWPRLPGLRDFRWQLGSEHPTLHVGVRELPEYFSPATAVTDSDRQAVELLFEGLVKPCERPGAGLTYEPGLTIGQPRLNSRGREFRLDREAFWSNGDRVSAADVRTTIQLLAKEGWRGFSPEWAALVEPPAPGRDMSRVHVALKQGFFDPLSLLTFKILPAAAHLNWPDDAGFASNPVGSGPYQLPDESRQQREKAAGGVVFVASSTYHRTSKEGMPQIQEIRFFQPEDPIVDFKKGQLHLLLDIPTPEIKEIEEKLGGLVTVQTLRNRRIYFLAVNHQNHRANILRSPELRKAIAYSINRTRILDEVFRGEAFKDSSRRPHRPLNGPYPPGSWACKPDLRGDLFQPQAAKPLVDKLKTNFPDIKLTLKYPTGDKRVEDACAKIKEQVETVGIEIQLEPRSSRQLHEEVEVNHDYELAYSWYDYPSDAYWLWPLFNPDPLALGRGGKNYLGYQNEAELASLFQQAMSHRDPRRVQEITHRIHEHLYTTMPMIPLWQLDTHIAIHKDLKPVYLDPLLVFPHVEKWKLETSK